MRRWILTRLEKTAYRAVQEIRAKVDLKPCKEAREKLSAYTLYMCHVKDGAFELADTKLSFNEVWENLEGAIEDLPEASTKCKDKGCAGACTVDLQQILIEAVNESKEAVEGLCLICDKAGAAQEDCEHEIDA
jgi:hypothetical protein